VKAPSVKCRHHVYYVRCFVGIGDTGSWWNVARVTVDHKSTFAHTPSLRDRTVHNTAVTPVDASIELLHCAGFAFSSHQV